MSDMNRKAIKDVLAVAKRMDEHELTNAYEGNMSEKCDGLIYITPSGKNKAVLTEEMIAVIDGNGEQTAGLYKPSSELSLHMAMYRMRGDIGGVVHSHAPFLTAFAMCNKCFQFPAHAEFMWDHKMVEVLPYGRPGSEQIYAGADKILGKGRDIFLLANHGVVAVGETVWDALNKLESAEHAAKIYTCCRLIGEPEELSVGEQELLLSM